MSYAYNGFDAGGKPITGTIDASGAAEAIEALRKRGIFTTSVRPPHPIVGLTGRVVFYQGAAPGGG